MSTYIYNKGKESEVQKRVKRKGLKKTFILDYSEDEALAKGETFYDIWKMAQDKTAEEKTKMRIKFEKK